MKHIKKRILPLLLAFILLCSSFITVSASPAAQKIVTTPTGYTKASDVDYVVIDGIIANWGARGESCLFLTTYATDFYTHNNTYADLSKLAGSNRQSDVPNSPLYTELQELMASNHTFYTKYNSGSGKTNCKNLYQYTDCMRGDPSLVSTIYQGEICHGPWISGNDPYNQEHIWPRSKLSTDQQKGDIMLLRPCKSSENTRRGDDCYGEKSGSDYYDPGISVRGDCARMMLYMYVRWGNTSKMWGSSGVMESVDILLKWMEEDPVDTWEMGRNDSVQTITGTRNVFVDYPELAWLLFGKSAPTDMSTPSGGAGEGTAPAPECTHASTKLVNQKDATCTEDGYTGDTVCAACNATVEVGAAIPAGHKDDNQDLKCDTCSKNLCAHPESQLTGEKAASCSEEGYTGDKVCTACGEITEEGRILSKTGHTEKLTGQKDATCTVDGYTGDTVCADCDAPISQGAVVPATGKHTFENGTCTQCGEAEAVKEPEKPQDNSPVVTVVIVAAAAAVCAAGVVLFIRKRKK